MYALLSVSDKKGIIEFAHGLIALNYQILSTGGTLEILQKHNIQAINIADYTQSQEMFEGRVKTLHPKIHGGILYKRNHPKHQEIAKEKGIISIDIVCVNLYPFKTTIQNTNNLDDIIENIDIGGPTMVRAAAKNYQDVLVVTDTNDYLPILQKLQLKQNTLKLRQEMMIKAFNHTAEYECLIANYMNQRFSQGFGEKVFISGSKILQTRYGENPHQKGAFYAFQSNLKQNFKILKGEPSFNNLIDSNAAIKLASSFGNAKAVSIIKHGNPCGFAIKEDLLTSYQYALQCDPISAYGGVVAINGIIDKNLALEISKTFIEVLVSGGITPEALEVFKHKKKIKIFIYGDKFLYKHCDDYDFKHIEGGFVYQNNDKILLEEVTQARLMTEISATNTMMQDLIIAYTITALTKSNSVAYVKDQTLMAVGMGMTSRIDASRAAITKAKDMNLDLTGCVFASEAFLPFKDSVEIAADIGVSAIIQPGGSIRDQEIIACANEKHIALYFTGTRHFYH